MPTTISSVPITARSLAPGSGIRDEGPDRNVPSALTRAPVVVLDWVHQQEVARVNMQAGVIVGIDGSETASEAVEWAAATAAVHRWPLTICHVAAPPASAAMAEHLLAAAALRAHAAAPGVPVVRRLFDGDPD